MPREAVLSRGHTVFFELGGCVKDRRPKGQDGYRLDAQEPADGVGTPVNVYRLTLTEFLEIFGRKLAILQLNFFYFEDVFLQYNQRCTTGYRSWQEAEI